MLNDVIAKFSENKQINSFEFSLRPTHDIDNPFAKISLNIIDHLSDVVDKADKKTLNQVILDEAGENINFSYKIYSQITDMTPYDEGMLFKARIIELLNDLDDASSDAYAELIEFAFMLTGLSKKMIENKLELDNLKYIDIGGGYKTGYKYWTFGDYIKTIYIENNLYNYKPKIVFEPGNSLVKDAGYYCTKVIAKKELYGEDIVIVDGSTIHLPKGYLKSCEYDIVQDNYTNITSKIQKVCGATCKESDIFLRLQDKARLNVGDIIVFKQIGAYSMYDIGTRIMGPVKIYEGAIDNYVETKKN